MQASLSGIHVGKVIGFHLVYLCEFPVRYQGPSTSQRGLLLLMSHLEGHPHLHVGAHSGSRHCWLLESAPITTPGPWLSTLCRGSSSIRRIILWLAVELMLFPSNGLLGTVYLTKHCGAIHTFQTYRKGNQFYMLPYPLVTVISEQLLAGIRKFLIWKITQAKCTCLAA